MPWTKPQRQIYIPHYLPKKIDRKLLGLAIYTTLKAEKKRVNRKRVLQEAATNDLYCRAALGCPAIMQTYRSL